MPELPCRRGYTGQADTLAKRPGSNKVIVALPLAKRRYRQRHTSPCQKARGRDRVWFAVPAPDESSRTSEMYSTYLLDFF
jgi:hypothetical protein